MWDIQDLQAIKLIIISNDYCKKISCIDNKPLLLILGEKYLNVFNYKTLKNINKIRLNLSSFKLIHKTDFFIEQTEKYYKFHHYLRAKTKHIFYNQAKLLDTHRDSYQNLNFFSMIFRESKI